MKHYPAYSPGGSFRLSGAVLVLLAELKQELEQLAEKIDRADKSIEKIARENEDCRVLVAMPGVRYAAPDQAVVWFKCVAGAAHGRTHHNIAIVALANKLTRMAWAHYLSALVHPYQMKRRLAVQAAPGVTWCSSAIQVNLVGLPAVSIDHAIMLSQVKHLAADIPPILKKEPST